jgi:hypothetical protein
MSRMAKTVPGRSTVSARRHSSTKPRAGSSNLSGRTEPSGNTEHTSLFVTRALEIGLSDVTARRLVNGLRTIARRVASGKVDPYSGIVESRTLAIKALRAELAS